MVGVRIRGVRVLGCAVCVYVYVYVYVHVYVYGYVHVYVHVYVYGYVYVYVYVHVYVYGYGYVYVYVYVYGYVRLERSTAQRRQGSQVSARPAPTLACWAATSPAPLRLSIFLRSWASSTLPMYCSTSFLAWDISCRSRWVFTKFS